MKKYLHPKYLPMIVAIASVIGLLLRLWTLGSGPDAEGLYEPQKAQWLLLWLFTGILLAVIGLLSNGLKTAGRYADHFPGSVIGAAGCVIGALAVLYTSLVSLSGAASDLLTLLSGFLGIVSAVALMLTAPARFQGRKPNFLMHLVPCLFFALRVFDHCKNWSNLTQSGTFLFQFFASVCVMLATYQFCCFDVSLGSRKVSLFWSLSSVYFCVLALPMMEEPVFYAGIALWLMTNLCSLRPIRTPKPLATADAPESSSEEVPCPEQPEVE